MVPWVLGQSILTKSWENATHPVTFYQMLLKKKLKPDIHWKTTFIYFAKYDGCHFSPMSKRWHHLFPSMYRSMVFYAASVWHSPNINHIGRIGNGKDVTLVNFACKTRLAPAEFICMKSNKYKSSHHCHIWYMIYHPALMMSWQVDNFLSRCQNIMRAGWYESLKIWEYT